MSYQQQNPGPAAPQHPGGPQYPVPQQQFYPQPPKKSHRFRNFIVIPIASFVGLIVVIAVAASGGRNQATPQPVASPPTQAPAASQPAKASPPAASQSAKPQQPATQPPVKRPEAVTCSDDRNAPCGVKVGQAFTLGKHQMLAGWKASGAYGMFTIEGKVKNTSDDTSTAFFNVKFLKGDEVLGNVMCNSSELEPGQVEKLNCVPDGEFSKKYDRVTAEAMF